MPRNQTFPDIVNDGLPDDALSKQCDMTNFCKVTPKELREELLHFSANWPKLRMSVAEKYVIENFDLDDECVSEEEGETFDFDFASDQSSVKERATPARPKMLQRILHRIWRLRRTMQVMVRLKRMKMELGPKKVKRSVEAEDQRSGAGKTSHVKNARLVAILFYTALLYQPKRTKVYLLRTSYY